MDARDVEKKGWARGLLLYSYDSYMMTEEVTMEQSRTSRVRNSQVDANRTLLLQHPTRSWLNSAPEK